MNGFDTCDSLPIAESKSVPTIFTYWTLLVFSPHHHDKVLFEGSIQRNTNQQQNLNLGCWSRSSFLDASEKELGTINYIQCQGVDGNALV